MACLTRRCLRMIAAAGFFIGALGSQPAPLYAAFTLTVTGLRGGSQIDLGTLNRATTHEEVTCVMNGDRQYLFTQQLSNPMVNEHGTVLDPRLILMEFSEGSTGTIRLPNATPMSDAVTELFISNSSGASRLTILYAITSAKLPEAGTYAGTMIYTLQAVGGSSSTTVTMTIRLRVDPLALLELAQNSATRVRFGSVEPGIGSSVEAVSLQATSNLGGHFELVHALDAPLTNASGQTLPLSSMHLTVSFGDGVAFDGALEPEKIIPWDAPDGFADHLIELAYSATIPKDTRAGTYQGRFRVMLRASGASGADSLNVYLPVEIEVPEFLVLSVSPEEGKQVEFNFTNLQPGTTSDAQSLKIRVDTNMERAYSVTEEFEPLVSQEGNQFPADTFRCTTGAVASGSSAMAAVTAVPFGSSSLYQSDASGTPVEFPMACGVRVPDDMAPGEYVGKLVIQATPQ